MRFRLKIGCISSSLSLIVQSLQPNLDEVCTQVRPSYTTSWYKPWVPEEFIFFTLLAGPPSLRKFPYILSFLHNVFFMWWGVNYLKYVFYFVYKIIYFTRRIVVRITRFTYFIIFIPNSRSPCFYCILGYFLDYKSFSNKYPLLKYIKCIWLVI